jgi:hypothetical protein
MSDTNAALLEAHARGDKAGLIALYTAASDAASSEEEAAFFLTFAYVYALETAHPEAAAIRSRLVAAGREE